jgi:hypothetical protein
VPRSRASYFAVERRGIPALAAVVLKKKFVDKTKGEVT